MQPITMCENEWRLLVDLVDGFHVEQYDTEALAIGIQGLQRMRLVEENPNGFRVTALGQRVRAAEPPYTFQAPRVWFDRDESGAGGELP